MKSIVSTTKSSGAEDESSRGVRALKVPRKPNRISFWVFLTVLAAGSAVSAFTGRAEAQSGSLIPSQTPCVDSLLDPCPTNQATQQTLQTLPSSNTGQPPERMPDASTPSRIYVDSAGNEVVRQPLTSERGNTLFPPDPITDFQRLTKSSIGELLPVFGRSFFEQAPSTFAPGDQLPVTPDYVVGPGDDLLVRITGPETFNSQLTVDRSGSIYIPKVGSIHVAGLHFEELQAHISSELSHTYRNFQLSVNLGRLRSIQVYVVGEARRPGAYTISSLSTVLNALFASGGPDVQGSLRHIQVRRLGQTLPEFDLYDVVLRGDQADNIRLQTGDTIFIPPVGPQVALGGSVRHPAIYELKGTDSVADVLALASGFSATASSTEMSLDRIQPDLSRHAMTIKLDDAGRSLPLRDGDVLYAGHITAAFSQSVTLRGNLSNPGRFAWHEGMRLSDILPDRRSLLTTNYWVERNRLGVPTPLFEPAEPLQPYRRTAASTGRLGASNGSVSSSRDPIGSQNMDGDQQQTYDQYGQQTSSDQYGQSSAYDQYGQLLQYDQNGQPLRGSQNGDVIPFAIEGQQNERNLEGYPASENGRRLQPGPMTQRQDGDLRSPPRIRIGIPAPEIDWSYAVIERLNPETLKSSLVPFNLGRLVQDHDPSQNLPLQPGDVVTILSQNDVTVPLAEQTKYVRLEGEFAGAGVYSVGPDETLAELVRRAGGLTPKAYMYGSSFLRESARVFQQQRLDEYISTLSVDMERATAVRTASSSTGILDPNALAEQRSLISQLRQLRATGRIVLEFGPTSMGVQSIPPIPLENGDIFRIPSRPNTVSVIGAVSGQNVFLYNQNRRLEDYVSLAGDPNRIADTKHAFIIRADGSVFSRERSQGVLSNHFNDAQINPGDSIVIPEKLIKPSGLRNLIDYSQILSSFGLAAAAINVVR